MTYILSHLSTILTEHPNAGWMLLGCVLGLMVLDTIRREHHGREQSKK